MLTRKTPNPRTLATIIAQRLPPILATIEGHHEFREQSPLLLTDFGAERTLGAIAH
jgi:hypothetical protein